MADDVAYLNTGTELSGFAGARYIELAKRRTSLQADQKKIQGEPKKLGNPANNPAAKLSEDLKPIQTEVGELPKKMAACFLWKTSADFPHELIMAGETLFAGGDDPVAAFDTATGKERWSSPVTGRTQEEQRQPRPCPDHPENIRAQPQRDESRPGHQESRPIPLDPLGKMNGADQQAARE